MLKHSRIAMTVAAVAIAALTLTATSANAALWTPDGLGGISLQAWWDASDASTITEGTPGTVQAWADKSGNGYNATAPNAGQRPLTGTRTIGGLNAIEFDAHTLNFTTFDLMGKEAFAVFHQDDAQDMTILGGGGNSQMTVMSNQTLRLWKGANPYTGNTQIGTVPVASDNLGGWLAHLDNKKFSVNGTLTVTGDTPTGNNMNVQQIGRQQYANADGLIGEIVVTSGILSADDRARLEGYLAWKWGTQASLPGSHAYANAAPEAVPTPAALPAGLALIGFVAMRRRRRA